MEPRDFSNVRQVPGVAGNAFDVVLNRFESIDRLPFWLFGLILLVLAMIPARLEITRSAGLWAFFLFDWALVESLPRLHLSYGPPKPAAIALAFLRMLFGWLPAPWVWILQWTGTILVIWAFFVEPLQLRITRRVLESDRLPPGAKITLLHIGDLHVERLTRREKCLMQLIADLSPDIICFSGDLLNLSYLRDPVAQQDARQVLNACHAPLGSYFVRGSPAVDLPELFPQILDNTLFKLLTEDAVDIPVGEGSLRLIGITCTHLPHLDAPRLAGLIEPERSTFRVLLYHSPDLAPEAAKMGVDLQLSGHTHGGQVCFPLIGPLFTGSLYGRIFSSGSYLIGKMTLYITRGIGMEGKAAPRVRFLCPPEGILWEISGPRSKMNKSV